MLVESRSKYCRDIELIVREELGFEIGKNSEAGRVKRICERVYIIEMISNTIMSDRDFYYEIVSSLESKLSDITNDWYIEPIWVRKEHLEDFIVGLYTRACVPVPSCLNERRN